jgi:hypothetical protein
VKKLSGAATTVIPKMNSLISAQIAAAQASAEKVFHEDRIEFDLGSQKTVAPRGFGIELTDKGNIVSSTVVDKRPVEGPRLGEVIKAGSPVHAPGCVESWGKPPQRS